MLYAASCLPEKQFIIVTHKATDWKCKFKNITEFCGRGTNRDKGWIGDQNEERLKNNKPLISYDDFTIEKQSKIIMSDKKPRERIKASVDAILRKPWCKELILAIGGESNYRNDLWISRKYKGNRGDKPKRFTALRDWVIKKYNPIIANNCETDDVVAIRCLEGYRKAVEAQNKDACDTVLISIDKDLRQIPGYYYNYSKHEEYPIWISPSEGYRNFWKQMLLGDPTDNILGLPYVLSSKLNKCDDAQKWCRCGAVAIAELFKDCKQESDYIHVVESCYKDYYTMSATEDTCEWEVMIQEAFLLLRMQEFEEVVPDYFKYKEKVTT